jgi:hypothetical protein
VAKMGGTAAYFAIVIGLVGLAHPIYWAYYAIACPGEPWGSVAPPGWVILAFASPAVLATLASLVAGHRSWDARLRAVLVVLLSSGVVYALFWAFVLSAVTGMGECFA